MFRLDGKVALVTGAARGIGAAIADGLAQAGAIALRNDLAFPADSPHAATGLVADVTSPPDVERMFAEIDRRHGRIDILVNNAGIVYAEDIFDTSLDNWHRVLETHLTGAFLCSKLAMERMRSRNAGRVIFISSMVAHQGALRGFVHYATAKGGQLGFMKTLARTAAPFGVTVNAIAPGVIATEMLYGAHGEEGVRRLGEGIPLGMGHVEDVAAAAIFLASDEAHYITGTVIDVNGGMYMH